MSEERGSRAGGGITIALERLLRVRPMVMLPSSICMPWKLLVVFRLVTIPMVWHGRRDINKLYFLFANCSPY